MPNPFVAVVSYVSRWLQPFLTRLGRVQAEMERLKMDVTQIKADLATQKQAVTALTTAVTDVKAGLTSLSGTVKDLSAQVQTLKDELANGTAVTMDDLNAIDSGIQETSAAITQASTDLETAINPPSTQS